MLTLRLIGTSLTAIALGCCLSTAPIASAQSTGSLPGNAKINAGVLSLQAPTALAFSGQLTGQDMQLNNTSVGGQTMQVTDATGSNQGWNVSAYLQAPFSSGSNTLSNSELTLNGSSSSGSSTASPSSSCASGSSCTLPTNGTSYPVSVPVGSPGSTVYNAASFTGEGSTTVGNLGWWLAIPGNTPAGSYSTSVIVSLSSGPGATPATASANRNNTIVFDVTDASGTTNIYSISSNGSNMQQLTNVPSGDVAETPDLSPNGTTIAYASDQADPSDATNSGNPIYSIFSMNIDGNNVTQLTDRTGANTPNNLSPEGDTYPQYSPSGTQLTYDETEFKSGSSASQYSSGFGNIAVANANGTDPVYPIADPTSSTSGSDSSFGFLGGEWSSTGQQIVADTGNDVYSFNADGSNLTDLTNFGASTLSPAPFLQFPPYMDSNGDIYTTDYNTNTNSYQIVYKPTGGSPSFLTTTDNNFEPSLSPNGKNLLYVHCDSGFDSCQLVVANPDGTNPQVITPAGDIAQDPQW